MFTKWDGNVFFALNEHNVLLIASVLELKRRARALHFNFFVLAIEKLVLNVYERNKIQAR